MLVRRDNRAAARGVKKGTKEEYLSNLSHVFLRRDSPLSTAAQKRTRLSSPAAPHEA